MANITELRQWVIDLKRKNAACLYALDYEMEEGIHFSDEELDAIEVRLALYELIDIIKKQRGL